MVSRRRFAPVALAAVLAVSSAWAGESRPQAAESALTAAILPGSVGESRLAPLPKPLSASDAGLYRHIFSLQDQGNWAAADRELGRVQDGLLKGHVAARRLLAPASKARLPDIKAWLADHGDHPQADAVYRLAGGGRSARGLKAPVRVGALKGVGMETEADGARWELAAYDVDDDQPRVRAFKSRLRELLRDDESGRAEAMLSSAEAAKLVDLDFDRMRLMVAADHFAGGRDEPALGLAQASAMRSGEKLPAAHWISGLSLWRMGKPDQARRHFEAAASASEGQDWLGSAAAFWAARANLAARRPEAVNHWLEVAATQPRTFYGMLARAELGYLIPFTWETAPFTEADGEVLMRVAGARRALALLQVGRADDAEDELRRLYPSATKALRQSMLALAEAGGMPGLAVRMGGSLPREKGRLHDAAAYPVPDWTPQGGWRMDRALIYALARQESGFNPSARSPAGAVGLMQLMPATATALGGRAVRDRLSSPEVSLGLGQRYVSKLLEDDTIKGNLLLMAAAYNAGPGTLGRWLATMRHGGDPLLLLESLPSSQTRVFVQRVMVGHWAYGSRLEQPAHSLEALASGEMPRYVHQEAFQVRAAKGGRN